MREKERSQPSVGLVAPKVTSSRLQWNHQRDESWGVDGAIVHSMAERVVNDSVRWGPVGTWTAHDWLHEKGISAHAAILPDGIVDRWVSSDLIAFHAGKSRFEEWEWLNQNFLGCEWLVAGEHNYRSFLEAITKPDCYSEAQYDSGGWLYASWAVRYGFDKLNIVGHSDVSGDDVRGPGKGKHDPGDGFDWGRFQDRFDEWYEELRVL